MAIDLRGILAEHKIRPRSIIHVGAHEGEELDEYRALGVQRVLFIEANPDVFARLQAKMGNEPGVGVINCAIADYNGTATLRITSGSMSSSLLPLKLHSEIYPQIVETRQVQVPCFTIDTLIDHLKLDCGEFNLLHLDIQGAELMALKGARRQMIFLDAIRSEVNRAELYEGCPLIGDVDAFLSSCGYGRVAEEFKYHPSWGDAVYIGRRVVSMAVLGQLGRWGNQLFQYMFLKTYGIAHGLEIETPRWSGTEVFRCTDPPLTSDFPHVDEFAGQKRSAVMTDPLKPGALALQRTDFVGYFQYHTRHYAPYRQAIRAMFRPAEPFAAAGAEAMQQLRQRGSTIFAIHLRRGDYREAVDKSFAFIPPNAWYLRWLRSEWPKARWPLLYIASDDVKSVVKDFAEFKPVTATDLDIATPSAPQFIDYHVLCNSDRVAISNSTFSFHACMLNEKATQFVRPSRNTQGLVPFNPWDDDPLWRMPKG